MPVQKKTKRCNGCGRTLPIDNFARHKGHGDGFESQCKACMRVADKRRREAKQPVDYPAPLLWRELQPEQKKMVEQTPDGFKRFFEKYSGLPLHEHGYTWAKVALENDLLLLNVPPGHAKTTIMAQWYVIWTLACDRNAQIIVVSKTMDGAKKTAYKIAYELEFNKQLNIDFGRFRPRNANSKWSTGEGALLVEGKNLAEGSGDVSVQIRGQLQQILGMRATLIIADDASDWKTAKSPMERDNQLQWFLGEVMTRLQPEGKAVCIGQRVHVEDLYGMLSSQVDDEGSQVWNQISTPAILDRETKKVLWPEMWPWEKLERRRAQLGAALFETMYQQNPEAAGEFVRRAWIEGLEGYPGCLDRGRIVGDGGVGDWERLNIPVQRVISIDPSPTRYCGIVVADVPFVPNSTVFSCNIVDISRGIYGLSEMLEEIERLTLRYGPQICIFEQNSAKWLHEDPTWNMLIPFYRKVIGHNTVAGNKQDPVMGVWSLGADFEAGRIRFPYGDAESRATSEQLITEALSYPNGRTDDVLMALWFIKPNYKQLIPPGSMPTRFARGQFGGGAWKGWS